MGCNRLSLDQGDVGDKQAHDAFALAYIDPWIGPDPWKLLCELKDMAAHLAVECGGLLLTSTLIILNDAGVEPQLLVPLGFKGASDEAIIGIDLHVAPPRELSLVTRSLDMLTAQSVSLRGSGFDLVLDRKADLQRHRRHQFNQQRTDRRVDDLAGNRLADLSALAGRCLLANISWNGLTTLLAVVDTHTFAAEAAKHAALEQGGPFANRSRPALHAVGLGIAGETGLVRLETLPVNVSTMVVREDELPVIHLHLDLGHTSVRPV